MCSKDFNADTSGPDERSVKNWTGQQPIKAAQFLRIPDRKKKKNKTTKKYQSKMKRNKVNVSLSCTCSTSNSYLIPKEQSTMIDEMYA